MKSRTKNLTFDTPGRRAFVSITQDVAKIVAHTGIREGCAS
ncbi:MAG: hypothetical protein ACREAZ_13090 [Nitrososphaera sp.]